MRLKNKESLDKRLTKLSKEDKEMLRLMNRKVQEILDDPHRFKPLKRPMQNKSRVHIGGSFVLIYEIDEVNNTVTLLDFDHHDNIYKS